MEEESVPDDFPEYCRAVTGRRLQSRPEPSFVVLGLFHAHRCGVEPGDALDFLGRFGTTEDVADEHARLFPAREATDAH